MTIRKGEAWGRPGGLPSDGVVAADDGAARAIVEQATREGTSRVIGLTGGDLFRTLGGRPGVDRLLDGGATTFACDLGIAELDGVEHVFVAHVAVHRGWWRGTGVVVMNAAWLGGWNAGPRAHPSDGLLDVTEFAVGLGQRRAVARRLRTGAHLPHPGLRARRVATAAWTFDRPMPVHLDGVACGAATELRVRLVPDGLTVVV